MNLDALELTLAALRDAGRLEQSDEALVAVCRSTAEALDSSPGRAALVKEYRECLVLLLSRGSDGGDELEQLLRELSGTAVVDETSSGT